MHYSNTQAMLDAQRDKQTIYLENVLELMQALFADVRYQTGKLVEDCEIENMERLVAQLSTVTGNLLFVIRKREKEILSSESRYVNNLEKVRKACDTSLKKIKALEATIEELQGLELRQKEQLELEESRNAELLTLTRRRQELQQQIDSLQAANPETENARLQQNIAQQEKMLAQLQEQFRQDKEKQQELETENSLLTQQVQQQERRIQFYTEAVQTAGEKTLQLEEQLRQLTDNQQQAETEKACLEQSLALSVEAYGQTLQALDLLKQQVAQAEADLLAGRQEAARQQETAAKLQQQVAETTAQAEDFAAQNEWHQTRLEKLRQQVALQLEQLAQNNQQQADLEAESCQLRETLMEQDVALELQKAANLQFRQEHLDRVCQELAEAKTLGEADRQQLQIYEQQVYELRERYKTLSGELSLMKVTEHSTRKMVTQEQEKLDAQKQVIGELEAQVREKASESTALMDREEELRRRLDEKNLAQIKTQIAENISKLEQTLEQAKQEEENLNRSAEQLEQAQQNRNRICLELEKCRSQNAACQDEYDALMEQYQKLADPAQQKRMEKMSNQLTVLKKLAGQLTEGIPCGASFRMDQAVSAELDRAEHTMQILRQSLRQYAQCRQEALEE